MKIFLKQKISDKGGFTIVETLVAITIFITAVTAVFGTVQSSLSNAIYAKTQVQAFFLAQEAIEYIRNARDTNILVAGTNSAWLNSFATAGDACEPGRVCTVDVTLNPPNGFATCSSPCQLRQQPNPPYLYGQNSSWNATNFRREVSVQQINANEIVVTVNVYWSKGITNKTFTLKESIFNWP